MAGIYHTDWANVLRSAGLPVVEVGGWKTRGHGGMGLVKGVMWHHTVGGGGDIPSLGVLVNGRPGLGGPLCNLGLSRSGVWYTVAAGLAYHAGAGNWQGVTNGNGNMIGIEAENRGTSADPWPDVQLRSWRLGTAALARDAGFSSLMVCGHKEYALPKGRKPDPHTLNMSTERELVDQYITDPEDPMALTAEERALIDALHAKLDALLPGVVGVRHDGAVYDKIERIEELAEYMKFGKTNAWEDGGGGGWISAHIRSFREDLDKIKSKLEIAD